MKNVLLAGSVLVLVAAGSPRRERIVEGDGILSGALDRAPVRIRIDPAAPAMPSFSAAAAARAGLKGGIFGATYRIGNIRLQGSTAVATVALPGSALKRRVGWFPFPLPQVVDGAIGPGGLDEPVVRFVLRPPVPASKCSASP